MVGLLQQKGQGMIQVMVLEGHKHGTSEKCQGGRSIRVCYNFKSSVRV